MKLIKVMLGCVLLCTALTAHGQDYKVVIDKDFSPYTGSSLVNSGYNFYKFLDDRYVPSSAGKTDLKWIAGRLGKSSLELILSSYLMVLQHEVFGHGYRAREFDFSYVGYKVRISSGYTAFSILDYDALNLYQRAALSAAGLEANTILAQELRDAWFAKGQIDNRDTLGYILNQLEQFRYVYSTSKNDTTSGNDVTGYISDINAYYGNQSTLSHNKLRNYVLLDLLDPALYYSLYGLGKYIISGSPAVPMYMLNIKEYKYLPAARTIFAPWGIEVQLQNFVKTPNDQFLQVNLRYGSNSSINSFGIDFCFTPVWKYKKFVFGNQLSVWRQPKMIYANAAVAKSQFGFAEFIKTEYKLSSDVGIILDVGYKTAGFMQGYQLANNVFLRFGCKW